MKELIERFYNSIQKGNPLPIPYREIILTARIMDEIFAQIYPCRSQMPEVKRQESVPRLPDSGFLSSVSDF